MPARNTSKKVMTPIQGDDAYVIIKIPTYGDMKRLTDETKGIDPKKAGAAENLEFATKMVKGFVLQWNWVKDDEGTPFEFPPAKPSVVDELTTDEVLALVTAIFDGEDVKKKDMTPKPISGLEATDSGIPNTTT